jgi:MFS family permease
VDTKGDVRVLRSVALRALLVAEVISTTGSQMTWLALPWFVLITTGSPARMSFVVSAELGGYILLGIPGGSAITRFGARRTMLFCDAMRGPLMLAIPLLHNAGLLSFWLLLLIAATEGALGAPYGGAQRVLIPELLGESEASVGRANALFQGATRLPILAGPALAGVLISVIGATNVLVIDALTYAVAFGLVILFVPRTRASADGDDAADMAKGLWAGIHHIASDPILRIWAIGLVFVDGCFQVVFLGLPVLVVAHYGRDPRLAGFLFGSWGAGAVVGNLLSYRYLSTRVRWSVIAPLVFIQALPLWVLALPVAAPVLIAAMALAGILNGLSNPTFHALLTLRPPPQVRAKVVTTMFTASGFGGPFALLIAGPAFDALGVRTVLAIAALGVTAALALEASVGFLTGHTVMPAIDPGEHAA